MPMTVAELKEVVSIDITGVDITDLNELTIVFIDSGGTETNIDNTGSYDVINSTVCGDTMESYFVFIAQGSGENTLTYGTLQSVLGDTDDTNLVYLLFDLQSIPPTEGTIIAVESAVMNITRLTSVSAGGTEISRGILTLKDVPLSPCPSSSSSSFK